MGDIVQRRYGTSKKWYMGDILHGGYMGDMVMGEIVHKRYDTREISYMENMVHGRYGTWKYGTWEI